MVKDYHDPADDSRFLLCTFTDFPVHQSANTFKVIWCRSGSLSLRVDHRPIHLHEGEMLCLAPTQRIDAFAGEHGIVFQYNRAFYCILEHDREVGCVGLLYYGSNTIPRIRLDEKKSRKVSLLFEVFVDEFETHDNIQEEMLRMLLKRLIILCTRWYKEQSEIEFKDEELDIIRQFHVLLEQHFRTRQTVADYAEMLYRAPKTLAHLFARNGEQTPLRQIHERIALEARRLLAYTDKPIKEIAAELNFREDAHFSRFFRRLNGQSPTAFRQQLREGVP